MAAKKLSVSELQALIRNAKSEIEKRQKRLDRVKSKVDTILKNEGVTLDDLYATHIPSKRPVGARKKRKVKPVYKSGKNLWTGRGRAPGWVVKICEKDGVDVTKFKTLSQYKI
ncbi:MAG: H-NS histone family protein [Pseudomonadota bacterium]|nr:H-NS histone family protein [Pseudomonadota bacterium]MEE3133752.1 H-NS histone family protein [Pseudomonadota bacterium]